jgi:hypothetical protein
MPLKYRRKVEGITTKKLNKVFFEAEKRMGCRYAIGYFICLTYYFIMSSIVLFFNYFYPSDYIMSWLLIVLMSMGIDMIGITTFTASI